MIKRGICFFPLAFLFTSFASADSNSYIYISGSTAVYGIENIYILTGDDPGITAEQISSSEAPETDAAAVNHKSVKRIHKKSQTPVETKNDGNREEDAALQIDTSWQKDTQTPLGLLIATDEIAVIVTVNNTTQRNRKPLYNNLVLSILSKTNRNVGDMFTANRKVIQRAEIYHRAIPCGFLTAFAPNSPPACS